MKEPKIRFKGFRGEWEKKKLGAMTSVRGGYAFQSSLFQKSGIPVVRISNILSNGNVGGDFVYYPRLDGDTNITIHEKDVVIAMSGATTGKIARVDVGDGILYQNQRVGLFTKTGKVDYDFLYTVLNRPHFNELLNKLLTSSAQPNASSADIESIEMEFPEDAEEQKALSNYILSLDSLIQSTTKKIESLKQVKAASLQSMFPQEGETTPRVRFKGFEGEWEKVLIGKMGVTYSGLSGKTKDDFGFGEARFITFLNVLTNAKIDTSILEPVNVNGDEHQNEVRKGDLLFNTSSETPEEVGMCAVMDENLENVYLNSFCFGFRVTDNNIDPTCVAYMMRSHIGRRIMSILAQGATRYNLSKNSFCKAVLVLPKNIAEQRAIASYFTTLDRQITLQTQRLEKLKQIKAACLDKMFV